MCGDLKRNKMSNEDLIKNIYFFMHCLYNAETEIHDRSLTDRRDRYDPTSAYINISREVRNQSNSYALHLYRWCRSKIEYIIGQPFNCKLWKDCVKGYERLSAQDWIDLYNSLMQE